MLRNYAPTMEKTIMICRFVLATPLGEFYSAEHAYSGRSAAVDAIKRLGVLDQYLVRIETRHRNGTWELLS